MQITSRLMSGIIFKNVSKTYRRKPGQTWLKNYLQSVAKGTNKPFQAVRDVSFSVKDGESIALIGRNGAGKSTVLNLMAGLLVPNAGSVQVTGRVAALLDLGAGFHVDLTGLENLTINAALMGFSKSEVRRQTHSIIEFSGLGDFIDQPIRTYSSGMTMRLAFSVAACVDPDILIIDEVLGVGDAAFQAKCIERIRQLKEKGKIFFCVSHGMAIDQLCEKAIWLEQGVVRKLGFTVEVMRAYAASLTENVEIRPEEIPVKQSAGTTLGAELSSDSR